MKKALSVLPPLAALILAGWSGAAVVARAAEDAPKTEAVAAAKTDAAKETASAVDPSGEWDLTLARNGREFHPKLSIKRDGEKWSGELQMGQNRRIPLKNVTLEGNSLKYSAEFTTRNGETRTISYAVKIDGDSLQGETTGPNGTTTTVAGTRKAAPATLEGEWAIEVVTPDQTYSSVASFKREGDGYAGTYSSPQGSPIPLKEISLDGGKAAFTVTIPLSPDPLDVKFAGTLQADEIKGEATSRFGPAPFTAKRKADPAANLKRFAGDWDVSVTNGTRTYRGVLSLSVKDGALDGSYRTTDATQERKAPAREISVTGDAIKLLVDLPIRDQGEPLHLSFAGKLSGDEIQGTESNPRGDLPFVARRKAASASDFSGTWAVTIPAPDQTYTPTLTLAQAGDQITGSLDEPQGKHPLQEGTLKDGQLRFIVSINRDGQDMTITFTGKRDGDKLAGEMSGPWGAAPWTAVRK
jgi:hypothetical protein